MDDRNTNASSFRAALEKFKQFARDCTEDAMRAANNFRNNSPPKHTLIDNKIKVIDNTKNKLLPIVENNQDSPTSSKDVNEVSHEVSHEISHEEDFEAEQDEDLLSISNTKSNIAIQTINKSETNYNITNVADVFKDNDDNNNENDGLDHNKGSLMTMLEKSDVSCTIIGDPSEDFSEACKIVCEYDEESMVSAKKCEYACLAVNKLRDEVLKTAKEISNKGEHEKSEQRTIT